MNALHSQTRGRFVWLETVECDAGVTIRTARAELPTGLVIERVDGADEPLVFVTDAAGREITVTTEQSAELFAALSELPRGPTRSELP